MSSNFTDIQKKFEEIYERKLWGGGSGPGSRYHHNLDYINFLANFIKWNDVRSVVDFGCGDWQFMQYLNWQNIMYYGFDVAKNVVRTNMELHARSNISFTHLENSTQLPKADLLLCKDVFQHLPNAMIADYMRHFKTLYRHILITNDDFPAGGMNVDIAPGAGRPLRLDLPPFNEIGSVVFSWIIISEAPPVVRKRSFLVTGSG